MGFEISDRNLRKFLSLGSNVLMGYESKKLLRLTGEAVRSEVGYGSKYNQVTSGLNSSTKEEVTGLLAM